MRTRTSAFVLVLICFFAAFRAFGLESKFSVIPGALLVLFLVLEFGGIKRLYRFVATGAILGCLCLYVTGRIGEDTVYAAIDRAVFFAFFFTGFSILREAANTSALIRICGETLVAQPPARRYTLMTIGGHILGIMLNFGALNVLGVTIINQLRAERDNTGKHLYDIKLRRMFSAVQRGIAAITIWSPTSFTMLIVFSDFPGFDWGQYAPFGLGFALCFLLVGALFDRFSFPRPKTAAGKPLNLRAIMALLSLIGFIPVLAAFIMQYTVLTFLVSMLVSSAIFGLGWIAVQDIETKADRPFEKLGHRLLTTIPDVFTSQRNEITMIGFSAFIGVMIIPLIDINMVSTWLTEHNPSQAALLIVISWFIVLASFVGINSVVTVTIILGLVHQIPELDFPPIALISVISVSWAVMIAVSPLAAAQMLTARLTAVPVADIVVRWNGLFCLTIMLLLDIVLILTVHG